MQSVLQFEYPWALVALLLLPLLLWLQTKRSHKNPSVYFPGIRTPVPLPRSRRQGYFRLLMLLRATAIALLILALAGPWWGARKVRENSKSIGIQLLVDHSGSMSAQDLVYEGKKSTRLEVVKRISEDFIFGNGSDLKGRDSDMVGLIAFAGEPITLSPLTLAHSQLRTALNSVQPAQGLDDGTAIGDAVALAAARFHLAESSAPAMFKSKIIILLTDGENNSGERTIDEATRLAKNWGLRIYAIGIRPVGEGAQYEQEVRYGLDTLVSGTRGISRVIEDGSSLRSMYAQIDQLEKADLSVTKFLNGFEMFPLLLFAAAALLILELTLAHTWLLRIP
jgi:Ca-activated chloride channel family protein